MKMHKTAKGLVVEVTHTVHGMLEQGGLQGRRVLVTRKTLARLGVDEDGLGGAYNDACTHGQRVIEYLRATNWRGDRVLTRGTRIR